jgi:hypothetical protein
MQDTREVWYRYVDIANGHDRNILLIKVPVLRRTPKGVWLDDRHRGRDRFVLNSGERRFAYPTLELAMDSFKHRKRWQIRHLERQLLGARQALGLAEAGRSKPEFSQFFTEY